LASDDSGQYVDVVALDAGLNIDIGTVDQGSAGTEAWKVDGSAVTQPVSAASLPLPANAARETGGNLASLAGAVSAGKVQTTVATALPAGSNTIGGVNVASAIPAGQNNIGNVGGKTATVTATPTVTASNSYGANFVVGGLLTFSTDVRQRPSIDAAHRCRPPCRICVYKSGDLQRRNSIQGIVAIEVPDDELPQTVH
jgi:hypothetical protein